MCILTLTFVCVLLAFWKFELVSAGVNCNPTFPQATSGREITATWNITEDKNFGMMRLVAGPLVGGSSVIIGSPAAKGIWCKGSCTLQNVWWESVGTHAANFGVDPLYWSNTGNKYIIEGGGVQNAVEKPVLTVVGLNANFQDTLSVKNLELCDSNKISFVCQAYQGTNDYSGGSGTGPKPTPTESITVGSPLNGTTCKDPSAKIDIIN